MGFKLIFYEAADFQLYFLSIFFFYLNVIDYSPKTSGKRERENSKRSKYYYKEREMGG